MENNNFARGVNYRKLSEKYISLPFLLCLSPLVFLFLGVIISRSPNHRPELIELYNSRTEAWIMVSHDFLDASFSLNETAMSLTTDFNGDVFPVSDACNRTGDPRSGCIYTSSSYFRTYLPFSHETERISIGDGLNVTYLTDTLSFTHHEELSRVNLHCTSTEDCQDLCSERSGFWEEERDICNITRFLSNVCYRLRFNGTRYALDRSDLVSSQDVGCFASAAWSPYLYSPNFNSSLVPIDIRLNFDPVVSASLFTDGCSDAYLANAQHAACFGIAYEDQQHMARVFVVIFFAVFAVETIVIVAYCMFWVAKKRNISPTRIMSPSYEKIFTPLIYAEFHSVELPEELAGLGMKGLHDRLAVNGTLRVPKPSFVDVGSGPVEILDV